MEGQGKYDTMGADLSSVHCLSGALRTEFSTDDVEIVEIRGTLSPRLSVLLK
jgi:hypothetical protein